MFERAHFLGNEFVFYSIHSHIYNKTLVCVQEGCQGVHGTLADRVEAQVDHLKLSEASQLVEKLDGALVGDATLLESQLLKLVAERGCCGHHLGTVIFDEGVTHVDGQLVVLHAFFEVCFDLSQELWVELVPCSLTVSQHHILGIFDWSSTLVVIWRILYILAMVSESSKLASKVWLFHHWVAHASAYEVILWWWVGVGNPHLGLLHAAEASSWWIDDQRRRLLALSWMLSANIHLCHIIIQPVSRRWASAHLVSSWLVAN